MSPSVSHVRHARNSERLRNPRRLSRVQVADTLNGTARRGTELPRESVVRSALCTIAIVGLLGVAVGIATVEALR